jgi:phytoene/squalene synthetase
MTTNIDLYTDISKECSRYTTKKYSTSFSSAIFLLHKDLRQPIYDIYGFVRLADEIVDSFHQFDKVNLLNEFKQQTHNAINQKISLNPLLHSFQDTVNKYAIKPYFIDSFLYSMELDLTKNDYDKSEYEKYIFGSAEVVGLMCLQVFCNGDDHLFNELEPYAKKLGAAFQKINFLRDLKADNEGLSRMYFPNCNFNNFTTADKIEIEKDIQNDFEYAFKGILKLPIKSRLGVYLAYQYYIALFKKIKSLSTTDILQSRIRIPDAVKILILAKASIRYKFNML